MNHHFYPANTHSATKIMLLGAGELGKEVIIEAARLGLETIAVDRYANAPAMQVACRSHVIDMKDPAALLALIEQEKPDYILPEIEAIAIDALITAEAKGFHVIPNARAVSLTMNRKAIRQFAAETLGLKTSTYRFVRTEAELAEAATMIGFPCVIKPVMSSSGHGQSVCRSLDDVANSWQLAQHARGDASELIVEGFVHFDYEITLLTARTEHETLFCQPIGHIQRDGDYVFSWQPHAMPDHVLKKAQTIAQTVTDGLGGRGIFGVELFIAGDEVYFSEVSPRPHDTGLVTLMTQSASEFALHVRAVLGLPLAYNDISAGASAAFKSQQEQTPACIRVDEALWDKDTSIRVFGKADAHIGRRLAVVLVQDSDAETAKQRVMDKIGLLQG